MKVIQVDMVTYETNTDKAGNLYTDGQMYAFHAADGTSEGVGQGAGEKMVEMFDTIDSLSTAAARLQDDLGAVKGHLITAQKRRDKAEKTVETLRADLRGSLRREEALKEELGRVRAALGQAQDTIKELEEATYAARMDVARALDSVGALERQEKRLKQAHQDTLDARPKVEPVSPANLAMLKEKYNVDDLLRLRAGGLV